MKKLSVLCLFLVAFGITHSQRAILDSAFGNGKGWTTLNFNTGNTVNEYGRQVLPRQDGSFLLLFDANGAAVLSRYKANGALDTTYGTSGFSQAVYILHATAAQQPDGKVVVAGYAQEPRTGNLDFALARFNVNGTLDLSFGTGGKLTTDFMALTDQAFALAVQPDGKLVAAGGAIDSVNGQYDFALCRYNSSGTPDTSFGNNGKITTDFMGGADRAFALVLQVDGRIVAAGEAFNSATGNTELALARYDVNGLVDSSFDDDGILTTAFMTGSGEATSLVLQADQKIVVAGTASTNDPFSRDFVLARYNPDGTLDQSFSGDGKVVTDFMGGLEESATIILDEHERIVLAGTTQNGATGSTLFALARYQKNGALDATFAHAGQLTTDLAGDAEGISGIVWQPDGKLLATGHVINTNSEWDFALVRYNDDGALDDTFGASGQVYGFYPFAGNVVFAATAIQNDGKIVVAGNVNSDTVFDMVVARYNKDGTLDSSFGGKGRLQIDFYGGVDAATAIAIQKDGKIVVAGSAENPATSSTDFALLRFNSDGSPDSSFDGDGKRTLDLMGNEERATGMALQQDGKIVLTGPVSDPATGKRTIVLACINPDGSLNKAFDGDGWLTTDIGEWGEANALVIQPNGKIVVAGTAFDPRKGYNVFAVLRYNINGTLDKSFDTDGRLTTDFGATAAATSIVLQPDEKIIVAGSVLDQSTGNRFAALTRYNKDGSLDTAFAESGIRVAASLKGDYSNALALQPDGKIILVAGYAFGGDEPDGDFLLLRYNAGGVPDSSFGVDGVLATDINDGNDEAMAAVLAGDRLYVAGLSGISGHSFLRKGAIAAYRLQVPVVASSFTLVDALTDKDLQSLTDGSVVNLKSIQGKSINIRANTTPAVTGSVVLQLTGKQRRNTIENIAPYALYGNDQNNYKVWKPAAGSYTLTATPYTGKKESGTAGAPLTVRFSVVDDPVLTHFTLVHAQTDKDIAALEDGAIIDLAITPHINIRANPETPTVQSVMFNVNGDAGYSLQNSIPFALASDNNGNYLTWKVTPGTYTITAMPYSANFAKGTAGVPVSIKITIINSKAQVPASITQSKQKEHEAIREKGMLLKVLPNPTRGNAMIQFGTSATTTASVIITDAAGRILQTVFDGKVEGNTIYTLNIAAGKLAAGVYFCRITTAEGKVLVSKLVKQ